MLALWTLGCRCGTKTEKKDAPLEALTGKWLVEVPVNGAGAARVAVPLGATHAKPLVIALHGDHDRPEWPCGSYHSASRRGAFVVCPEGQARHGSDRFTLGTVEQTGRELRALLPAVKKRFGAHLAKGPTVLAAIGPAVQHAIEIAREEPSFFSYLVLVDGALGSFTRPTALRFGQAGGKRVLFVCTRVGCDPNVNGVALALRSAGVDARVEHVGQGSGLDGATTAVLRKNWDWLVAGDVRWRR